MSDLAQLCDRLRASARVTRENAEVELYSLLHSRLIRMLASRSPEQAEDILQEVVLRVIRSIRGDRVNNPESIFAYAAITARNLIFNSRRRKIDQRGTVVCISEAAKVRDGSPNMLDDLLRREKMTPVMEALAKLSTTEHVLHRGVAGR